MKVKHMEANLSKKITEEHSAMKKEEETDSVDSGTIQVVSLEMTVNFSMRKPPIASSKNAAEPNLTVNFTMRSCISRRPVF